MDCRRIVGPILALGLFPAAAGAVTPGALRSYTNIHSAGFEWDVTNDADHDAVVRVQYRPSGGAWRQAMDLIRVDYNGYNMLAGSVLFLSPNTLYEFQLVMSDPDGGGATQTLSLRTRAVPALPSGGRTFHVVPGSGGGDGSAGNPFRGIAAAEAAAAAGDIILMHAGVYGGGARQRFLRAGASGGRYLVWKAAGDGEVSFSGGIEVAASYLWLEGLTIRNLPYAMLTTNAPVGVVMTRCRFINNHYNIYLQRGGVDWYIADNDITGDTPPSSGSFSGEGIELNAEITNSYGHTVAHNRITNVADGISGPTTNTDVFGNDIFNVSDDGIEGDPGRANVRIWGNRVHNALHNGVSFQPMNGAPWYIVRNQLVSFAESPFKFRTVDRFVMVNNTIVGWGDMIAYNNDYQIMRGISRNNLWINNNGGDIWRMSGYYRDWRTNLDFDGFDWGGNAAPFAYGTGSFSNLAQFSAASGLEPHAIQFSKTSCIEGYNVPAMPPNPVPAQIMTLRSGCNAIDAGAAIPNLTDGFTGSAPDMGAHEFGAAPPIYGPRPAVLPSAPVVAVYQAPGAVALDGALNEWSGASTVTFSGPSSQSSGYLMWDAANLYVAMRVSDSQLNAVQTVRDAADLWLDDAIELYLDTANNGGSAMASDDYQFLVNLNNVQGDLRGTGTGKDAAWNGAFASAVSRSGTVNNNADTDGSFVVELAIPWAQVGVNGPAIGRMLGLDLAADDRDAGGSTSSDWSGISSGYSQPGLWRRVQLAGPKAPPPPPPPPPAATIPAFRAPGPVTLDGSLTEWVGASTASYSGASQQTSASFMWDAANLYIAMQVNDAQLNASQTQRDAGNLYLDDAVEVYLDTLNNGGSAMGTDDYQLIVNLNNVQGDLRGTGAGKDASWNAAFASGARRSGTVNSNADTDASFTIELAIPWAQVGVSGAAIGKVFGMDLVTDDLDAAGSTSKDWAGITGSYAQPGLWKKIQLADYKPTPPAPPPPPPPPPLPPGVLGMHKAPQAITVNGDLTDWTGASTASFSGTSNRTDMLMMWSDSHLYLAFQVRDGQLNAIQTARDAAGLYLDDAIEVYIDTLNNGGSAMGTDDYQFLVNLNNVQGDLRGTGSGKDPAWNAAFASAASRAGTVNNNGDADATFDIEMAIPWQQLGVSSPAPGKIIGLDIVNDDKDAAGSTSKDWANITGSYGQPGLWKKVQLLGPKSTDLNGDGTTNVVDVQLAINQALALESCGTADVDGDGACNVMDVQRTVNAALGLQ